MMNPVIDQPLAPAAAETDLPAALHRLLAATPEPQTVSKIRSSLPSAFRQMSAEELTEALRRQANAGALHLYPPYRSQQDRFWDRSMPVHIAALLREALQEGPLPWSQLRRKMPAYAQAQAETILNEQVAQGLLFRHPRGESRGGDRFGVCPPDPKDFLGEELSGVFHRLEKIGFSRGQVRAAALEMLHDEEWAPTPPAPRTRPQPADAAEAGGTEPEIKPEGEQDPV